MVAAVPPLDAPLIFAPFLRPMPWGGQRLAGWLEQELPVKETIGEAWLLSDHALHASVVAAGPLRGMTLRQLVADRSKELLGVKVERFPLLIKLLDARENLSVQVHPGDAAARDWAPQEGGKSEAWYVLESEPQGAIHLGLKPGVDRATVEREMTLGTLPLLLRRYAAQPGQCYNVPAGTIHALGGGVVVLECQQTSDATFRLYDWGRLDAAGQPRPLHLEAGLACLKERPVGAGLVSPTRVDEQTELLAATPYFRMKLVALSQPMRIQPPAILVGLDGAAYFGGVAAPKLTKGTTALTPAALGPIELHADETSTVMLIEINQA